MSKRILLIGAIMSSFIYGRNESSDVENELTLRVVLSPLQAGGESSSDENERRRVFRKIFCDSQFSPKWIYVVYASKTHYYYVQGKLFETAKDLLRLSPKEIIKRGKPFPIDFTLDEEK